MIRITWFKVDDGFWSNPKTLDISNDAVALWLRSGTWASQQLTDGRVPHRALALFNASQDEAGELVTAGLWVDEGTAFRFHDWDEYQPSAEAEKAKRAARAEAGRKGAEARWNGKPHSKPDGKSHSKSHSKPDGKHDAPSRPVPSRPEEASKDASPGDEPKVKETRLPASWAPTAAHVKLASETGIDLAKEAEAFRLHAETHDRHAARWNAAFTTWLKKAKPSRTVGRKIATNDEWMYR